jgi:hypothetical protein
MDGAMSDTSMVQRSNIDDENEKLRAVAALRHKQRLSVCLVDRETRILMVYSFVSGSNPL